MNDTLESANKFLKIVGSPLRFFALVVGALVVLIIGLAWKSTLPPEVTVNIIYITFGMLLILIILVVALLIVYPKRLVFDQEAHLTVLREGLGDSELPTSYEPTALPKVAAPRTSPSGEDQQ